MWREVAVTCILVRWAYFTGAVRENRGSGSTQKNRVRLILYGHPTICMDSRREFVPVNSSSNFFFIWFILLGIFNFSNFFHFLLNLFRSNFVPSFIFWFNIWTLYYDYQKRRFVFYSIIRAAWNKKGLQMILSSIWL